MATKDQHGQAVVCPRCQTPTDSLKCYTLTTVVFFFIGMGHKGEEVTACPSCMRELLLRNSLSNLISANVISPFVLLWNACLLLGAQTPGHSRTVREQLKPITNEVLVAAAADLAMAGAGTGAIAAVLFGSLAGLLGGGGGARLEEWLCGPTGGEWGELIGAPLAGCLAAAVFAGRRHRVAANLAWAVLGAGAWTCVRLIGGRPFDWAVGEPQVNWAITGSLAVILGATSSLALCAATTTSEKVREAFGFGVLLPFPLRFLVRTVARPLWVPPVAGAVGAALPAALGGVILAAFNGHPLWGAVIGGGVGLLGGMMGGVAVSREYRPSLPATFDEADVSSRNNSMS